MNTQRRLRRVVGKDSSIAYEHPVREGREMVMCQPILREISTISRPFHVKYIGSTLIVSPTLSPEKADEVMRDVIEAGQKKNKKRVTFYITPHQIYVNCTLYRFGLTEYPMEEIGMVYVPPENPYKLFGITVQDPTSFGYRFYIYNLRQYHCLIEDMEKEYYTMREIFLMNRLDLKPDPYPRLYLDSRDEEPIPYYEKLQNIRKSQPSDLIILNKCLYLKREKHDEISVVGRRERSRSSDDEQDYEEEQNDTHCVFHSRRMRPEKPVRLTIMAQLRNIAAGTCQNLEEEESRVITVSVEVHLEIDPTTKRLHNYSSSTGWSILSQLSQLKLSFPPPYTIVDTDGSIILFYFCETTCSMSLRMTRINDLQLLMTGMTLRFSPCSFILTPFPDDATTNTVGHECHRPNPLAPTFNASRSRVRSGRRELIWTSAASALARGINPDEKKDKKEKKEEEEEESRRMRSRATSRKKDEEGRNEDDDDDGEKDDDNNNNSERNTSLKSYSKDNSSDKDDDGNAVGKERSEKMRQTPRKWVSPFILSIINEIDPSEKRRPAPRKWVSPFIRSIINQIDPSLAPRNRRTSIMQPRIQGLVDKLEHNL